MFRRLNYSEWLRLHSTGQLKHIIVIKCYIYITRPSIPYQYCFIVEHNLPLIGPIIKLHANLYILLYCFCFDYGWLVRRLFFRWLLLANIYERRQANHYVYGICVGDICDHWSKSVGMIKKQMLIMETRVCRWWWWWWW